MLVDEDDPKRVGPNIRGDIYTLQNGEWVRGGPVNYPEGWYIVPPSYADAE